MVSGEIGIVGLNVHRHVMVARNPKLGDVILQVRTMEENLVMAMLSLQKNVILIIVQVNDITKLLFK